MNAYSLLPGYQWLYSRLDEIVDKASVFQKGVDAQSCVGISLQELDGSCGIDVLAGVQTVLRDQEVSGPLVQPNTTGSNANQMRRTHAPGRSQTSRTVFEQVCQPACMFYASQQPTGKGA